MFFGHINGLELLMKIFYSILVPGAYLHRKPTWRGIIWKKLLGNRIITIPIH